MSGTNWGVYLAPLYLAKDEKMGCIEQPICRLQGWLLRCSYSFPRFGPPPPCPRPSSAHELPLRCIERKASLVEVVEGKAGGAAATNAGAAIFLGVVAGMAAALGLDPLSTALACR